MTLRSVGLRLAATAAICASTAALGAWMHPIHSTLSELAHDPKSGAVQVTIRTFTDDFGTAVETTTRKAVTAASMATYVSGRFVLQDSRGARIPLAWKSSRVSGDVRWIYLEGKAGAALNGGSVRNSLVFDVHRDQVNVLKANYGGVSRTLLFTHGTPVKRFD